LQAFQRIFNCDIQFVCLQDKVQDRDKPVLEANKDIVYVGSELREFADTAGLIDNVDLVISVDTSVAHLAGAMSKPLWVLLPFSPDFRWLLEREDSPWYPTARLFRQPAIGDWESVMARLEKELAAWADSVVQANPR
jgi:hypothetical protein